jgi:hypothetical protein
LGLGWRLGLLGPGGGRSRFGGAAGLGTPENKKKKHEKHHGAHKKQKTLKKNK